MKKHINPTHIRRTCAAAFSAFLLLASAGHSRADLIYSVSIDVASLVGNPNGPFSLDLQLLTGSGNVSNKVTLSNFIFTGGTLLGAPDFTTGGESGSLSSTLILTNTASDNEFAQEFSGGVRNIQFNVDETLNSEVVGSGTATNDQFNVAIFDLNGFNIPTTDPSGADVLLSSEIASTDTLASIHTYTSTGADPGVRVSVPDGGSTGILLLGALGTLGVFSWASNGTRNGGFAGLQRNLSAICG